MVSFRERTRFATLVAIGLSLLLSGIVAGAAGGNFILGQANSAGTSNTSLTTSSTGSALLVTQNGTGTAIRGSTGSGAGIAGFFTSGNGSGVSGVVANENNYGVYAANDSADEGTGAALRVNGKQNVGVNATSDDDNAVQGTATNCDTDFLFCGANGVQGEGYAFGAGVAGIGTDSLAGVSATEGAVAAVYATSFTADVPSVYASSSIGSGVYAFGEGASAVTDCTSFYCAGVLASGDNGVLANTATPGGYALYGEDSTGDDSASALVAVGDAVIFGDLFVSGTCTGCAAAAMAVNGSDANLGQGDAVALAGVRTAPDGTVVLEVRAAKKGDQVLGIVERAMSLSSKTVKAPAGERKVWDATKGEHTVKTPARELKAQSQKWVNGGTRVAADAYLRIITSGVFAFDGAAPADAEAGDALAVSGSNGKLGKAAADSSAKAGRYLGKLKDGRVVLLVSPS